MDFRPYQPPLNSTRSLAIFGLLFFLLIPWAAYGEICYYRLSEPFFGLPLTPDDSGSLTLRSDDYGEGHFGASRNGGRSHEGVDFRAAVGDPVWASKSGRVSFSGVKGGYGKYIEIRHADGLLSRYAHLSELALSQGHWAKKGQLIGRVGKTGNASAAAIIPHLHFEIKKNHDPLDPGDFLVSGGPSSKSS
ncbi:MAG: M23 family metallopeptidase [Candidatus Omnitrophica bacterium]|nr:M23 family metallopeptidase [Candidatus Omnitrophota bacterium]